MSFATRNQSGGNVIVDFDQLRSVEKLTILSVGSAIRTLLPGQVLGRVRGAVTDAAWAGNTGSSGTIGTAVAGAGAKEGVYKAVCIEPATDAGKFLVFDPDGLLVGIATVAVEFVGGGLTFTITDATDFVAGDGFDITVAVGTTYVEHDQDATNGAEIAVGVLLNEVEVPASGNISAAVLVREAVVRKGGLVLQSDIDAGEKATVFAQLTALGIICRDT